VTDDQPTSVDLEAERRVVGAMLIEPTAVPEAADTCRADDFYRGAHGEVFAAAIAVYERERAIDLLMVADELHRAGQLDDVGGQLELSELAREAATTATVRYFAQRVARLSWRRGIELDALALARTARDPDDDLTDALEQLAGRRDTESGQAYQLLSIGDPWQLADPSWIIDGHLPEGVSVLYGPSGSGKSFAALDWSLSVAAGRRWFGHGVDAGPVVYVAAEGARGLRQRIAAWSADRRGDVAGFYIGAPVDLLDSAQLAAFLRRIAGEQPRLVVFDTLAKTMLGDENETATINAYTAACDRIHRETGAAVLVVHHTGHTAPERMRGNSALFANVDAVVRVDRDDAGVITISQPAPPGGKAKDAEHFAAWHLELTPVGDTGSAALQLRYQRRLAGSLDDAARQALADTSLPLAALRHELGCDHAALGDLEQRGVIVRTGTPSDPLFRLPGDADHDQAVPP